MLLGQIFVTSYCMLAKGIEMSWWKYQEQPRYKTDRGVAAIYAALALIGLWASVDLMKEGYVIGFLWVVFAGQSVFHMALSVSNRNREN